MKLFPILAAVGFAALIAGAFYWNRRINSNLPPLTVATSSALATVQAASLARETGGTLVAVLGTGSMAGYLPNPPAGADPAKTVVAYVVVHATPFDELTPGALCLYNPAWAKGANVLHVAAQKDSGGWIMVGTNNEHYESWERMTAANFKGRVAHTFTW